MPLLIPIVLLISLFLKYKKVKKWPEVDKCVEIIALSAGIYLSIAMLLEAFRSYGGNQTMAWALLMGSVAAGLVSIKGTWSVFSSIKPRYKPQNTNEASESEKNARTDGEN